MIEAYFENIKNILANNISEATMSIEVAVAWFTHRELFKEILSALDRKVSVEILLSDSIINRGEHGLDFSLFLNKGGKLKFANSVKSFMHNKFCVIDEKLLITGSYNWTYAAEKYNSENIVVTDDTNVCNSFHTHFITNWEKEQEIETFEHLLISECTDSIFAREFNDLKAEYEEMKTCKILKASDVDDIINRHNNTLVTRLANVTERSNRQNPILKMNVGMRCRINGVDNRVLHIIEKRQKLPFTNIVDTQTAIDNQSSAVCDILYGSYENADKNESLLKIELDNLPLLPAGEVKFKTKVTLDTNGYMHVEYVCVNTGVAKEAVYINREHIEYSIK